MTSYHNKNKKEETSFREGTPVQEETSQEGEERIKANGNEGNQGNRESKDEEEKVDVTIEIKEGKNLEFDGWGHDLPAGERPGFCPQTDPSLCDGSQQKLIAMN